MYIDEKGKPYPLTIVYDRYGGTYSNGKWTAWNCHPWNIPEEISGDDIDCMEFWLSAEGEMMSENIPIYGVNDSIDGAILDLILNGKMKEKKERAEDGANRTKMQVL